MKFHCSVTGWGDEALQFLQSPQSAIPVEDFFARHASVISFDTAQNPPIVCFASALRNSLGFALVDHRL